MRTALLAAAILIGASAAHAADMPVKAPLLAAPPSWTGWYIGINGGGTWGKVGPSVADPGPDIFFARANVPAVLTGGSQDFNTSGGLAGGQIGYLYQMGAVVFGLEAGVDWTSLRGSTSNGPTLYPVTPPSTFSWNLQAKQDFLFTFLGRAGPDMGMWFPYLTAGVALGHQTYTATYIDTFYPSTSVNSFTKTVAGLALGGGVEVRFGQHWLLRGEYLHIAFDSFGGNGVIACTPGVGNCVGAGFQTTFAFGQRFKEDIVRAALSYKF